MTHATATQEWCANDATAKTHKKRDVYSLLLRTLRLLRCVTCTLSVGLETKLKRAADLAVVI